ncbi:RNA ligase, DRB0094 family [Xylariaceae sp. AK1471]|nr:RNA ligase, DRB0094 family [Xylariaceae sp. AK1471]
MARKLVSIRKISAIRPLPGSPRIQIAVVDGWTCGVRAQEFSNDELVVFFEIDCFLPSPDNDARYGPSVNPFHLGVSTWKGSKGIRVKSQMIDKSAHISQGLVLKLQAFPEVRSVVDKLGVEKAMEICFAEKLGVRKWELSTTQAMTSLGQPPVFFPKTDLERVQNLQNLFTPKYAKSTFQESVKLDGSSMTIYYIRNNSQHYRSLPTPATGSKMVRQNGRIGVCSRNHDLNEFGGSKFWEMACKYQLPEKLERISKNLAIQGELVGSTICQNRLGYEKGEHDFFVFSIFDVDVQRYLHPRETEMRASQLGLKHVPVLAYMNLQEIAKDKNELIRRAEGIGMNGKKREGLVYKNVDDGRAFKVIANGYLLAHDE